MSHEGHMKRRFPCIESMTKVVTEPIYAVKQTAESDYYPERLTVRVWREEDTIKLKYDNSDIREAIDQAYRSSDPGCEVEAIVHAIASLERINAIEILDCHGNGTVVYTEWP